MLSAYHHLVCELCVFVIYGCYYAKVCSLYTHFLESIYHKWCSAQFISVTQSCLTVCNTMDCSTPGFPVPHQLPEVVRTHIH